MDERPSSSNSSGTEEAKLSQLMGQVDLRKNKKMGNIYARAVSVQDKLSNHQTTKKCAGGGEVFRVKLDSIDEADKEIVISVFRDRHGTGGQAGNPEYEMTLAPNMFNWTILGRSLLNIKAKIGERDIDIVFENEEEFLRVCSFLYGARLITPAFEDPVTAAVRFT